MHVLVAGAGIVGVSCAIWLQRAGHSVTLVDRVGPAAGASFGNAGVLAAGGVVPVTVPGLWRKVPGMLMNPNAPLFLRWSYLPRLLPFLARYLSHATDAHVGHYGRAIWALMHDSVDQHLSLARGTPAEHYITRDDYCYGYVTTTAFDADRGSWDRRRALGVPFTVQDGDHYAEDDPVYSGSFATVVRFHDHGRISDPGAYVQALADHFVAEGGTLLITELHDLELRDGQVAAMLSGDGRLAADKIVLAMGPWSDRIARKLGVRVPLESERGYHVEWVNPSRMPKRSVMITDGKFVITPMQGRLRAAGVVEFGGLRAGPSRAPLRMVHKRLKQVLPDISCDSVNEWMGHRPTTPDSLPLIGATDAANTGFAAFGHQHLGLTGGPRTGRLIADLISGRQPNLDLSPFAPDRFEKR